MRPESISRPTGRPAARANRRASVVPDSDKLRDYDLIKRSVRFLTQSWREQPSLDDLAGHLGLSHSAVESRLHRARRRLRAELASMNVVEAVS